MSNSQNGVQLSVAGKVALITGGSRGIGAATVKMFCTAGAKVVFNYQKAKAAADRVIAECGTDVCAIQSDLARDGIYVNCVAPGWVATDMAAPALANPKTRDRVFGTIPLGRVGKPEEIAAPILFLCTEHAGFITGEILNVNGGAVLVG